MMHDNKIFQEFAEQLAKRGVRYHWLWETRRDQHKIDRKHSADIGMLAFTGNGFQPSVLVAIATDHDGMGFGLFIDDGDKILADVDRIAKPRDTTIPDASDAVAARQ